MMMPTTMLNPPATQTALYRTVWRWHFIAGLLVLPFLVSLAVTGGLYLFTPEINHVLYRSLEDVPARAAPMPMSLLVKKAKDFTRSDVLQIIQPAEPDKSVEMLISTDSGESRTAFVDPYDGRVLGTIPVGGIMEIVRKIHSLQYFGFWASCLIEIAAGWVIILALSGLYLWWPRGRNGGVVTVRATPKHRMFWRDLHAVTGLFASAVIVFMAVTGMPWSKVWGKYVQQWTTNAGLGQPKPPAEVLSAWKLKRHHTRSGKMMHHHDHAATFQADLPWALEKAVPPASHPPASQRRVIGIDAALAIVSKEGLPKPFSLALPIGPRGAYMASYRPNAVEKTRTLYIDQYSGRILGDIGFAQYGPAAKAIEWGIAVHQGLEYGTLNRILMLSGCVAILMLAVSAPVMWWKRRPKGSWGLPPAPGDPRIARGVGLIMGVGGLLFPLVGLSMIVAFLCIWLYDMAKTKFRSSDQFKAAQ